MAMEEKKMKTKRKVKDFLNELAEMITSKGRKSTYLKNAKNLVNIATELKKFTDGRNPSLEKEKEFDDTIAQTIWINLRFSSQGRQFTEVEVLDYAWLIYELVNDS
jgi:hypothetical protein